MVLECALKPLISLYGALYAAFGSQISNPNVPGVSRQMLYDQRSRYEPDGQNGGR